MSRASSAHMRVKQLMGSAHGEGNQADALLESLTENLATCAALGKPPAPSGQGGEASGGPRDAAGAGAAPHVPLVEEVPQAGEHGAAVAGRVAGRSMTTEELVALLSAESMEAASASGLAGAAQATAGAGASAPSLTPSLVATATGRAPASPCSAGPLAPPVDSVDKIVRALDNISSNAEIAEQQIRRGAEDDGVKELKMRCRLRRRRTLAAACLACLP